jgi:hypothetical protein
VRFDNVYPTLKRFKILSISKEIHIYLALIIPEMLKQSNISTMNENWQISIPRVDTLNTSIPLIKLQNVFLKSD